MSTAAPKPDSAPVPEAGHGSLRSPVDQDRLIAIITDAFPELSGASFTLLTQGWDSVAIDVDDRLIFKFPRHDKAEKALRREAGVLTAIRPAVTVPVPELSLFAGPPLFSRHAKLKGEHLLAFQYRALPEDARRRLAVDLATFYAELHALRMDDMAAAGAVPLQPWLPPDEILQRAWPALPEALRSYADETIQAWQQLPPDPCGTTFGYFDGHGWNMAFDHAANRLNGLYDFADSGFGPVHQEFIYSTWIGPDLTRRIIEEYEALTGRVVDRRRVDVLGGVIRLSELAQFRDDAGFGPVMLQAVADWAAHRLTRQGES